MKVLLGIDSVFAWLWHWPLRIICGITGKSNFFVACIANTAAWLVYAVAMLIEAHKGTVPWVIATIFVLVTPLCALAFCVMFFDIRQHKNEGTLSIFTRLIVGIRVLMIAIALIFTVFWVQDIRLSYGPSWLSSGHINRAHWMPWLILVTASLYFATDTQPRRKSWLRRGVERLKSGLSKIRLPSRRWAPGLQGTG